MLQDQLDKTVTTQVVNPDTPETNNSVLTGDRLCIHCGYNLIGLTITREPHYGLFITRCPECGTVASLQEYPLLGRWAKRWGMLFAALWFVVVLALWAGSSGLIMGMCMGTGEETSWPYGQLISELYQNQSTQSNQTASAPAIAAIPGTPTTPPVTPLSSTSPAPQTPQQIINKINRNLSQTYIIYGGNSKEFTKWWNQQDKNALLASTGGWKTFVNWEILLLSALCILLTFLIGNVWSVININLKRKGLLGWGFAILALAWIFSGVPLLEWLYYEPGHARAAACQQLATRMMITLMTLQTIPLMLGLLTGRSIIRQVIRLILPPRQRSSLALLWTVDGMQPPGVKCIPRR